mmetsp:Transcript_49379/g.148728  ORF Transcript_49379/g.148728 Transcript_49379/m.148728 type:complete len:260 (-) Transcript_49379:2216-2995(-)
MSVWVEPTDRSDESARARGDDAPMETMPMSPTTDDAVDIGERGAGPKLPTDLVEDGSPDMEFRPLGDIMGIGGAPKTKAGSPTISREESCPCWGVEGPPESALVEEGGDLGGVLGAEDCPATGVWGGVIMLLDAPSSDTPAAPTVRLDTDGGLPGAAGPGGEIDASVGPVGDEAAAGTLVCIAKDGPNTDSSDSIDGGWCDCCCCDEEDDEGGDRGRGTLCAPRGLMGDEDAEDGPGATGVDGACGCCDDAEELGGSEG